MTTTPTTSLDAPSAAALVARLRVAAEAARDAELGASASFQRLLTAASTEPVLHNALQHFLAARTAAGPSIADHLSQAADAVEAASGVLSATDDAYGAVLAASARTDPTAALPPRVGRSAR